MAEKRKAEQVTLRVLPEMRDQLTRIANALGLDMNALLNVMIRRALPYFEILALRIAAVAAEKATAALTAWQKENPEGRQSEFWAEWLKQADDELQQARDEVAARDAKL